MASKWTPAAAWARLFTLGHFFPLWDRVYVAYGGSRRELGEQSSGRTSLPRAIVFFQT